MAKAKQDAVRVTNVKNRTYNGVRHGETVEIRSHELVSYLAAGFEVARTPAEEPEDESPKGSKKSAQTAPETEGAREPEAPADEPEAPAAGSETETEEIA